MNNYGCGGDATKYFGGGNMTGYKQYGQYNRLKNYQNKKVYTNPKYQNKGAFKERERQGFHRDATKSNPIIAKYQELFTLIVELRKAQKEYFKTHNLADLKPMKQVQVKADEYIAKQRKANKRAMQRKRRNINKKL